VNKFVVTVAIATVAALNVVLIVGAGLADSTTEQRLLAIVVPIMDLCLVLSSVLLARMLMAQGFRTLGLLFILNLVLFALALVVRLGGSMPPRWLLFTVDVYWLNLYLIALSKHWPVVSGKAAA
jgi:hypothetical protein